MRRRNVPGVRGSNTIIFGGSDGDLHIVDIADRSAPAYVSTFSVAAITSVGAAGLAYDSVTRTIFVTFEGAQDTVYVVDAAAPTSLSNVGSFTTSGPDIIDLRVDPLASLLFVQDGSTDDLDVFDVSDPSSIGTAEDTLVLTGSVATTTIPEREGSFSAIDASRSLYFLAGADTNEIAVVDYSTPTSLSVEQVYTSTTYTDDIYNPVVIEDTEILVVYSVDDNLVSSIDYSTPTSISGVDTFTPPTGAQRHCLAITNDGSRIFVGSDDDIYLLSVSSSGLFTEEDSLISTTANYFRYALVDPKDKTLVFTCDQPFGLRIFSIAGDTISTVSTVDLATATGDTVFAKFVVV